VSIKSTDANAGPSLLHRLLSINAVLTIILLLAVCSLMIGKEYLSSSDRQISSLNALAIIISDRLTGVMAFEDYALAQRSIKVLRASDDILAACLYDAHMKVVTKFHRHSVNFCRDQHYLVKSTTVSQKIIVNDLVVGELVLYANSTKIRYQLLWMFLYLLGVISLCYALFWLVARWFFDREIMSVAQLGEIAERISTTGDYTLRMKKPKTSTSEISNLIHTLNQLLNMVEKNKHELEIIVDQRTQQLMSEKRKVEATSLAKSNFLAKLSHDVRTPLTAIMGYAELLSMDPKASRAQREKGDIIANNADFISQLVSNLLDLSKIESGHHELVSQAFNINELVEQLANSFTPISDTKNLSLSIKNEPMNAPWVVGDMVKIRQILNNLLDNAFKNTKHGQIELKIRQQIVSAEQCMLECDVSDTGCGIPSDKVDAIFDNYVQLGTSQINQKGVGLGLAITKQYVDLMNGQINVRSELGRGTTFHLSLPLDVTGAPECNTDNISMVEPTHLPSILLVDDDPNCLKILQQIMCDYAANIFCASSITQARRLLEEQSLEVIFTDIELPDGEGFDLANSVLKDDQTIIVMSAYFDHRRIQKMHTLGIQHSINKPFSNDDVLRVIKKIVNRQ